jgi:putative chitinase
MLTLEMLQRLWPHGDTKVSGLLEGIAAAAPAVFADFGLNSDLVIAHAMAQFSHECGAGLEMVENIHYSAEGAAKTWPSRFPGGADEVRAKFGTAPGWQVALIDSVYGGRLGNRAGTHDGSNFIGRGLSQVTGRENYQNLGTKTRLDLVNNPDLACDPANALLCGVADFIMCGCLPFAEADDVNGVTKHLNGGFIGLSERIAWLAKWKTALGSANPPLHSTAWLQMSLNKLGADPELVPDGQFGPLTSHALRAFQASKGLDPDGKVSDAAFAAIDQALNA